MFEDRQLWKKTCDGDVETLDAWYRLEAPRLPGFLRQLLGDTQTAET